MQCIYSNRIGNKVCLSLLTIQNVYNIIRHDDYYNTI